MLINANEACKQRFSYYMSIMLMDSLIDIKSYNIVKYSFSFSVNELMFDQP